MFPGPLIPFGAEVLYKPSNPKDLGRLHKFEGRTLPGIFAGYSQSAGGKWNGDFLVADQEEFNEMHRNGQPTEQAHLRRVKEVSR